MAKWIGTIFLVILALLALAEYANFRRAAAAADPAGPLPYPRRRLSRRVGIAVLLGAAIALAVYPPKLSPWLSLCILVAVAILVLFALILLMRDLRESTVAASAYAQEMNRLSRQSAQDLIREAEALQSRQPKD